MLESSIFLLLRPINGILCVFGISHFSVKKSRLVRVVHLFYTWTVLTVFIGSFLYRISNVPPALCQPNAVAHSVMEIQQILSTIVLITIYYQVIFYEEKFNHLKLLMSLAEDALLMLNNNLPSEHLMTKILCEVIFLTIYIYVSFILFVIFYKVEKIEFMLLELFSSINPMFVINLNLMTFVNLAWFTRDRFQILKCVLIDACKFDLSVVTDPNEALKATLICQTPNELRNEFKKISQAYELLFNMINILNEMFGYSNLASMGKFLKYFCN